MTVKQVLNTSADLDFPNVLPTLDLDFANSKTLDPRITFTRSSGGSYVGADGLIKYAGVNEPRFDHDPATGESLGLLIEESRTNLKLWSEQLANDFITAALMPFASNIIVAPDGNLTADGIIPNSSNSAHYCDKVLTSASGITASQNVCCSVFFKKGIGKEGWFYIYAESGNALHAVRFNFDTKQLIFTVSNEYNSGGGVTTGYGVIEYPNGWYRLWIAGYPNTTTTGRRIRIWVTNETGAATFVGDTISPYLYAWGVQCEIGAFPTSYIPTQASTRTRAADLAVITGKNFSEWYKQIGYTIFSEHITTSPSSVFPRVFNISTSTDSFRLNHYQPPSADYVGFSAVENNIINYADIRYSNITRFSKAKMATTYDLNNVVLYVNGNFVGKDTTNPYPSQNRDRINIGSATPNGQYINSTISKITYYPYPLKDNTLQSLTS